ncbi:MAG TPA: saccharopine dehydrogenase NADP-binding domain-containing protein [Thermoleophilaceae bacterium]|nr:saccharopine dehydrogenase NADP-binding domain-containing protein [Thermoleophilaceae bacterium]
MAGRIVLFGATGYTGRLTAEAMVARGMRPLLAARSRGKLEALAAELGGLESAVADVAEPSTVRALVERGDVLVSTVGPFMRWGSAAAAAASTAGAHYLDSTGEPPVIREVFERYGIAAEQSGCGMLTAFGYDFVPGNLAGALALERAGSAAVRVDVGYFFTGQADPSAMSGGTRASLLGVVAEPGFAYRDGRVQSERGAKRYRTFPVGGREQGAVSVGCSEHYGLPRVAPQLREVNGYLGWFGPASRPMQVMSAGSSALLKVPGAAGVWQKLSARIAPGSSGGPDAAARARQGSHIVGVAYDAGGNELAQAHVSGADGYTFTARILAWGAKQAAAGALRGTGALGPVDGFGLRELEAGCAEAGLEEQGADRAAAAEQPVVARP